MRGIRTYEFNPKLVSMGTADSLLPMREGV
jgi:hypothetical protein